MTVILHIDYDEGSPETYRGAYASVSFTVKEMKDVKITVTSGNGPGFDYAALSDICADVLSNHIIMESSSVNHFVQDGGDLYFELPEEGKVAE